MSRPASASARWAILQCYIKIPDVTGTLFVVATPIGNLEDITLRALRILREVAVVAAEDTRHTGNLLRHFEITTPLLSVHEHNERGRVPQILGRLRAGKSVALVSDAGTPGVSDPGAELVRAVRAAGLPVVPVPGPSAVCAIMSVSGVTETPVVFAGFPPSRSINRKSWWESIRQDAERAIICFEAPHRIRKTLSEMSVVLGDRPILLGRELTKLHEQWFHGTAAEILEHLGEPKGELVFLIRPASVSVSPQEALTDAEIHRVFGEMTKNMSAGRRENVRLVAERLGMPVKAVYNAVERAKKLAE
jgi:16S rRNA (cytidine1402-2'-O)-methyltransferase